MLQALSLAWPRSRYFSNTSLSFVQNVSCNDKPSEYRTGSSAFPRKGISGLPSLQAYEDLLLDNGISAYALCSGVRAGEVRSAGKFPQCILGQLQGKREA